MAMAAQASNTKTALTIEPGSAFNSDRGEVFYEKFYGAGCWNYSLLREWWWHRRHVVKRFGLRRGMSVLEIGCGCGFHTNLFRRMGFACVGVDRSQVGIDHARKRYPRATFHCCDIRDELPVQAGQFDAVLARGCSHYHYDLTAPHASTTTAKMLTYLKPGGVFAVVIVSDLSGRRPPDAVWQNTLADYRDHFSAFGGRYTVQWQKGVAICGLYRSPGTTAHPRKSRWLFSRRPPAPA